MIIMFLILIRQLTVTMLFINLFFREKSNKKALQGVVREFSFICRGLIQIDPETES